MKLYCYKGEYPDSYKLVNRFMNFRLHRFIKNGYTGSRFTIDNTVYTVVEKTIDKVRVNIEKDNYSADILVEFRKDYDYPVNHLFNLTIRVYEKYSDKDTNTTIDSDYWSIKASGKVNELSSMFRIDAYLNVRPSAYDIPDILYFDKHTLSLPEITEAFWE